MTRCSARPGDVTRCGPPDAGPSFSLRTANSGAVGWTVLVYSDGIVELCERSTAIYSDECPLSFKVSDERSAQS